MCRAHSPSGEGDQPNTVSKGAQQHTNGVGRVALFVCVARLFYASDLFVRYLPMPLADGSQTADLFGSASSGSVPLEVLCLVVHGATRSVLLPVLLWMELSPRRRVLFLILGSASHGSLKTVDRFLQDRSVGKTD